MGVAVVTITTAILFARDTLCSSHVGGGTV